MTQMADEIRSLIADLYDDPEDFLRRPHPWFGGRSPDELMATEAGQFVLLKFFRGRDHMPPIEMDRDFKPYTTANADDCIDQTIARLEGQIEQLRALKGSGPEIATVIGKAREVYGDEGLLWLLEYNQVLQTTPLDLVLQVKAERVLTQLGRIEDLWRNVGDDGLRKATYRGGCRACQNLYERAIRLERDYQHCPPSSARYD